MCQTSLKSINTYIPAIENLKAHRCSNIFLLLQFKNMQLPLILMLRSQHPESIQYNSNTQWDQQNAYKT